MRASAGTGNSPRRQGGGARKLAVAGAALALAWLVAAALAPATSMSSSLPPRRILPPPRVPLPRLPEPRFIARQPEDISSILALGPHTGVCDTCHSMHGVSDAPYPRLLKGSNDNTLCDRCHATEFTPDAGGSYGGQRAYLVSAHGSSATMIWPGPDPPARHEADAAGKCLNCHDPHGYKDGGGLIPSLGLGREESLCLPCHDGSPAATDIESDLKKLWAHPTLTVAGIHTGPNETRPSDFAGSPYTNRHAECVDCHNPHAARADNTPPLPPDASKILLAVSRVAVVNGAAGGIPVYTFIPGSDTVTTPVTEYQLCFKCHSSWTVQPVGQSDLAKLLNPNNPSYHPVEAAGADPNIATGAFTSGWSAASLTACGDCHGSDSPGAKGPHGSNNRYILKKPYDPSPLSRPVSSNEACFDCHDYAVYGDSTSMPAVLANSRFNPAGATVGHAQHSGLNVPCSSCHQTHGSVSQPHLIVTGRVPGISSIAFTAGGGTCTPTCHSQQTYTLNYAR